MRCMVTGAAGFIGSTLVDRLLAEGHEVLGLDCLTEYYPPEYKRENLRTALASPRFRFEQADLRQADLPALCRGVETVFHLAAEPGVRSSFGEGFLHYAERNILSTQRLLEAVKDTGLRRFIYASTSSVYGQADPHPCSEAELPQPLSPYGATKLAGEHLCQIYRRNFGLPAVILRYFTVYGPRQRPDMAFNRFLRASLAGRALTIYGDGSQVRDFTYVGDTVAATCAAVEAPAGEVLNIGGGHSVTLREVLGILQDVVGKPLPLRHLPVQPGDMPYTCADLAKASRLIGYAPAVSLAEGLRRQMEWFVASIQSRGLSA